MADLSSIINTPDMPTAGQTEGVVTPMALENDQSIEQDNSITLDGQIDQTKGISNVSPHMQLLSIRLKPRSNHFEAFLDMRTAIRAQASDQTGEVNEQWEGSSATSITPQTCRCVGTNPSQLILRQMRRSQWKPRIRGKLD